MRSLDKAQGIAQEVADQLKEGRLLTCVTCRTDLLQDEPLIDTVSFNLGDERWHVPCADHAEIQRRLDLNASVGTLPGRFVPSNSFVLDLPEYEEFGPAPDRG